MKTIENYPIWHPYTQMQIEKDMPVIVRGEGAHLLDLEGNRYIDAVASWWVNLHGHGHPAIAEAIAQQARQLEQVIFAGFTHLPAIALAEKLLQRIPYHQKVFYSDNGSTAVEAALKMALQYWRNQGEKRTKIIAFREAYHGDTFGAMSISARNVFTEPYFDLLFEVCFIEAPVHNNAEQTIAQLRETLAQHGKEVAAFIFEPLVLGSSGMLMYSPEVLEQLLAICREQQVLAIADEVMTGFGRTGKFLATDYCNHHPDIVCLSKGISGGFLPFAATTTTQKIYDAFLSDDRAKMLFHGHSYTGNPLGCAAGIASLELFEKEKTFEKIKRIEEHHREFANNISRHKHVKNVRQQGTIIALDFDAGEKDGYLSAVRDRAYRFFMERRIALRPLGNVVYILPPYCIDDSDLQRVYEVITEFAESW